MDIVETESELLLLADMPGVQDSDVDIRFENGELTLHARRVAAPMPAEPLLWESQAGDFFRSFRITERIDASKIRAELKNGGADFASAQSRGRQAAEDCGQGWLIDATYSVVVRAVHE